MINNKKFIRNFFIGFASSAFIFFLYYILALKVGEVNIESVVERQISGDEVTNILFLSGLDQEAFPYKTELLRKSIPDVVALGSSRAMQVRGEFFINKFTNLGGAIQGVTDLEDYSDFINTYSPQPKLTILFVDPWWFNREFAKDGGPHQGVFPKMISWDHIIRSFRLLSQGNWIFNSFSTKNLGISAILTGEGFSKDGSYHYTKYISEHGNRSDIRFENTLERIRKGEGRFEKSNHPDPQLLTRACSAIARIKGDASSLVLVAPPFASVIWDNIKNNPDYQYIQEAYLELEKCLEQRVHIYLSMDAVGSSNDCEFIDGFHGGDAVYAKILRDIASKNIELNAYLDQIYLKKFIKDESGYAGGITRHHFSGTGEVDFLKLGCNK